MIPPSRNSPRRSHTAAPPLAIVVVALFAALMLVITEGANWMLRLSAHKVASVAAATASPFVLETSVTTANLRGIHAVGDGVVWASGSSGTVLRSEDSGYMWQTCAMPPGAEKLDFRAIWAWDANNAVVMSSGPGDQSRLYKTIDGCSHWKLVYTNPDANGFWDAMQFWSARPGAKPGSESGTIVGDPVDGGFVVVTVQDRGDYMYQDGNDKIWAASGQSAFAASNSSLMLGANLEQGHSTDAWFGTGGRTAARVYRQVVDRYSDVVMPRWVATPVPVASGNDSSGVFSLAFRNQQLGMAVGGDYQKPGVSSGTAAWTDDGGKTWTASAKPPHGFRSAVAWDEQYGFWITVGTNGADISRDDGKTWTSIDDGNWNAISLPWVVGPGGRIAKLTYR
jgi:photosystem II stability/assembly factor-like uncharacterized protein